MVCELNNGGRGGSVDGGDYGLISSSLPTLFLLGLMQFVDCE